ncbi:putative acyltransferase [Vibrio ruber DSM 16370]|uniref:Protein ElaA n=1 Tax=Vibrio ruber (strain DSM 16370 / JCM 11486 / BCRC 17186 / CECT 7878 / LMG 23124 / VR1) TaxID=1123498 RepID=A0A1R4LMX9_VIBR1|nr:GNAT family N-acetyltransferase [Vibrio ruber]SJN57634.1 putative acyltransferase [Vibrio ruber DSM 16370]
MITWHLLPFSELTTVQLYQLLKLRIDIFVVEQACPYPELDDKDHMSGVRHLLGYQDGNIIACARLIPPGISYPGSSIGRIATHKCIRGEGAGHQLLSYAIEQCCHLWPDTPIEIGAQTHLKTFYHQYGFVETSEPYLEDGIPHIDMKRV